MCSFSLVFAPVSVKEPFFDLSGLLSMQPIPDSQSLCCPDSRCVSSSGRSAGNEGRQAGYQFVSRARPTRRSRAPCAPEGRRRGRFLARVAAACRHRQRGDHAVRPQLLADDAEGATIASSDVAHAASLGRERSHGPRLHTPWLGPLHTEDGRLPQIPLDTKQAQITSRCAAPLPVYRPERNKRRCHSSGVAQRRPPVDSSPDTGQPRPLCGHKRPKASLALSRYSACLAMLVCMLLGQHAQRMASQHIRHSGMNCFISMLRLFSCPACAVAMSLRASAMGQAHNRPQEHAALCMSSHRARFTRLPS